MEMANIECERNRSDFQIKQNIKVLIYLDLERLKYFALLQILNYIINNK